MNGMRKLKSVIFSPALRVLPKWARCVRTELVMTTLIMGLNSLISLALALATKELIDSAVSGGENFSLLWRWGGVTAGLMLTAILLDSLHSLLTVRAAARLQKSLQKIVLHGILTRKYEDLSEYHSGELRHRLFSDVESVHAGILNLLPNLISTIISFVGAAIILVRMDWRFLPVLFLAGGCAAAATLLFRNPLKERHKRMLEAEDGVSSAAHELLEQILLIKASSLEKKMEHYYHQTQNSLENQQIRRGNFSILLDSGMQLVFDASWMACMLWGCFHIARGTLSYGSLIAIIQLISRIEGPIAGLIDIGGNVYGVVTCAERILDVTELPEEEDGPCVTDFDAVALENVRFRYKDGPMVLDGLSCVFRKGTFTALTGMSGEGKTSLFHLLLGIYQPVEGQVCFVQGTETIPVSRSTRHLFAYVPQGNTLFSGTLRDNLTMFNDDASEEEIRQAASTACLDDLLRETGFDTILGENGLGLSEGQAQRVCIARALLSKAPILLLDECTSALDEETEARLLQNLSSLKEKTCIFVTHRRAALSICSQILRLTEGRLEEAADPDGFEPVRTVFS